MGHSTKPAAGPHHTTTNMHTQVNRPTHSSTPSITSTRAAHAPVPLSPYSATHATFHRSSRASTSHCPLRNPLTPSYDFPAYPIHTPPPPAFVHSSLDIGDISCTRTQRQQRMRTRDHINVHDIEGAQRAQHRHGKRAASSTGQQWQAGETSGLLQYVRPAAVDTMDVENQPNYSSEPFSPHFASSSTAASPSTPTTPPVRPRSSPPTVATVPSTQSTYRSPYTRFSHSPHVLTPPTIPFAALYHTAVPSTDPLPPFRCTLYRTSTLPSNRIPLGGVDGGESDRGVKGKRRGSGGRKRTKGVSARVQCWRVSGGEVERDPNAAAHTGVRGSGEWQRMRVHDIELVSSLTL